MAERKETPRKVYPKSAIDSGCKCRLCGGIFEKARCKNLFKKGNEDRLRSAEIVNGGALICEEGFPHLLKMKILTYCSWGSNVYNVPD